MEQAYYENQARALADKSSHDQDSSPEDISVKGTGGISSDVLQFKRGPLTENQNVKERIALDLLANNIHEDSSNRSAVYSKGLGASSLSSISA